MKKMKVLLVGILTLVLSLFCMTGCFESGKYEAVSYKAGPMSIEISEENESYVELKSDKTVVMSIDVAGFMTLEGEGTWEKGEDNYILNVSNVEYKATIEKGVLTLDVGVGSIVFEK